jgi:hypothetical protein
MDSAAQSESSDAIQNGKKDLNRFDIERQRTNSETGPSLAAPKTLGAGVSSIIHLNLTVLTNARQHLQLAPSEPL